MLPYSSEITVDDNLDESIIGGDSCNLQHVDKRSFDYYDASPHPVRGPFSSIP
jgi:hypothetical protein